MKKLIFLALVAFAIFVACNKDDQPDPKPVNLDEPFNLALNETAELEADGTRITLLGILEDSRCPTGVNCIWAGRAVAEFMLENSGEKRIETLTDNPGNDPNLSTHFNAFGHGVQLLQVMPYPAAGSLIPEKDYIVRLAIGEPIEGVNK